MREGKEKLEHQMLDRLECCRMEGGGKHRKILSFPDSQGKWQECKVSREGALDSFIRGMNGKSGWGGDGKEEKRGETNVTEKKRDV